MIFMKRIEDKVSDELDGGGHRGDDSFDYKRGQLGEFHLFIIFSWRFLVFCSLSQIHNAVFLLGLYF